jgi:hypothetical protein
MITALDDRMNSRPPGSESFDLPQYLGHGLDLYKSTRELAK